MRVLVTGGTGFIGSNLVRELLRQGNEVIITGHDAEQLPQGFSGKFFQSSFLGIDWDAIGHVDVLYHQAAINNTLNLDRREMFRANVDSAAELFRRVTETGCQRIVYASSTAVYGNGPAPYRENQPLQPLNPYAESKASLDAFSLDFARARPDVTVVGLRYSNVYGPGEAHKGKRASMIFQLAQQMRMGNPRLFQYGEQQRDYIHVGDVVRANLLAADARESSIVNCGSGAATTFNALVEILSETIGTKRAPQYVVNPAPKAYQSHTECDMALAREKLGFIPEVRIRAGIREYFESGALVAR